MSVNRNENIIKVVRGDNGIGPVRYEFPGTLHLAGGGGGGASGAPFAGGAGGGGSTVVSASLSITPQITYEVFVGQGGEGGVWTGGDGQSGIDGAPSTWAAYTNNYNTPVTMSVEGGQAALWADPSPTPLDGGNSGTGSVIGPTTENYPGFIGGITRIGTIGGQPATATGGGAGSLENGEDGEANFQKAGNGGEGVYIPSNIIGASELAGGGGGGSGSDSANTAGSGRGGGGQGGDNQGSAGTDAFRLSAGGGGGGASAAIGGAGGSGANGFAHMRFIGKIGTQLGELDIAVTNATTSYQAASNTTDILFAVGVGTFRYTAPYPYVPKP